MVNFMSKFSLKSLHTNDEPTFHHNNQVSESQIDHILIFIPDQKKIDIKFEQILCQKVNSSNLSSHDGACSLEPVEPSAQFSKTCKYTSFSYLLTIVAKPKLARLLAPRHFREKSTQGVVQTMPAVSSHSIGVARTW
jgi:hypothetical protein